MVQLSIKQKLVTFAMVSVLLLILALTFFWANKFSTELYERFESENQQVKAYLGPPLTEAVWGFNTDLVVKSLAGLSRVDSFQFARVVSSGEVMAEEAHGADWEESWDSLISDLDAQATSETFAMDADPLRVYRTPLLQEDGTQVGILYSGFTRSLVQAEIRATNLIAASIGAFAFLAFGAIFYAISLSFTRPLEKALAVIEKLQGGDTSFETDLADRGDEIGLLGQALNRFRDTMIETRRLEAERSEATVAKKKLEAEREQEDRQRERD